MQSCSSRSSRFRLCLALICAVAVAVRLVIAFSIRSADPMIDNPPAGTDMEVYHRLAGDLVDGTYPMESGFYFQPFYYAGFLSSLYQAFGRSATVVIVAQSLLAGASIWLTGMLFAHLRGRRVGLLAAILLAVARMHLVYTPYRLIAVLQTFWIAAIGYCALMAWRRRSLPAWFALGLTTGLAIATRGNVQLFYLPVFILIWWQNRRDTRRLAAVAVVTIFGALLPQLPYTIVNYRATDRLVGASTGGGLVLALGNNPQTHPGGIAYPPVLDEWTQQDKAEPPDRIPYSTNVVRWIKREPLVWFELKFRTFLLFIHAEEVYNNVKPQNLRQVPLLRAPFLLGFGVIGSLGITGLVLACRRRPPPVICFLAAALVLYVGSILIFYYVGRYRVPTLPFLSGFAAITINHLWTNRKNLRQIASPLGLLSGAILCTHLAYPAYYKKFEAIVHARIRPQGLAVPLADRWLVADHGPQPFGGWQQHPLPPSATITKQFVLPPNTQLTNAELSFQIICNGASRVSFADSPLLPFDEGRHDLRLKIAQLTPVVENSTLTITLPVQAEGQVSIWIDRQRRYGRTRIGDSTISGEWVAELRAPRPFPAGSRPGETL